MQLDEENELNPQFTFMGITITRWTILYGVLLIAWASIVSVSTNAQSITSWIPAMLGAPILLAGLLCRFLPAQHKIWIHIAVVLGAVAFIGGIDFFRPLASGGQLFNNYAASASKLMLLITGAFFIFICIRSFIWTRRNQP